MSPPPPSSPAISAVTIISKVTIFPNQRSSISQFRHYLSVSDLPMLSCHYIQKGLFFPPPPFPISRLFTLLTNSLSRALSFFRPLSGRLITDHDGRIFVGGDDSGAEFSLATAPSLSLPLLLPAVSDVPIHVRSLFPLDLAVSFDGHFLPLSSFQLTELGDGSIFLAGAVNHAVADGTSFWNFFNAWAELCRFPALISISLPPDMRRSFFPDSTAVLSFPGGKSPAVDFPTDAPIRERIFHFRQDSISELKIKANEGETETKSPRARISSFQALCAQLWKSVTRARTQLPETAPTTFRMAVNCRRRIVPAIDDCYFGNAIQSIRTTAVVGEVAGKELSWIAGELHRGVTEHVDGVIRKRVTEWEAAPVCFPLGNSDGAGITMGSSPRFRMYERNDFGWGEPAAVRSGAANKFDGKISAFPGKEGGGSVDLEVCLSPETMAALIGDMDFMHYVSEVEDDDVAVV